MKRRHLEHGDDEPALTVLRRAVELGVDHIDTAEFYGAGRVNARMRAALHRIRGCDRPAS
ncbi:aldo/keto reductase [Streptomyces sp. 6N106]|uniref:aldo/keto reductase n=1 Tax=Streptomyces sp. 6N106 TaxID=3457418 RepID=UPI003FD298BB